MSQRPEEQPEGSGSESAATPDLPAATPDPSAAAPTERITSWEPVPPPPPPPLAPVPPAPPIAGPPPPPVPPPGYAPTPVPPGSAPTPVPPGYAGPPPAAGPEFGSPGTGAYGPPGAAAYGPPGAAAYGPPGAAGYGPGVGPAYGYGGYSPPPQTSGQAILALVLALLSWAVCPIVLAVVALVVAGRAATEIDLGRGTVTGRGLVTASRWIAWINVALYAAMALVFLVVVVIGMITTGSGG